MELLKLLKDRYSVRRFNRDLKVEDEKIQSIIEAGFVAPTAHNKQPQRILVLNNEESLEKLKLCTRCHFHAPLAFIICFDKNDAWVREKDQRCSGDIDASIVTCHMLLQIHSLGLGSTWVMDYEAEKINEEFNLPENYKSVAILTVGYPREDDRPSPLHTTYDDIDNLVFYNKF